jgi:glycosyltransferase involved in cell wall biosynthesis
MTAINGATVSILVPCLNARRFLQERVHSLLTQTHGDWEAIVLDSGSTDGSWEFFESVAASDHRFRLHQVPREGLYAALNRGLQMATGEFVHIATCDDTMDAAFLESCVKALRLCPQAGVAATNLMLINRRGESLSREDMIPYLPLESINDILSLEVVRSYPIQDSPNYRRPPHDAILHFSGKSVYLSLTQLVIRTEMARATGAFDTTVGSIADVGWVARLTSLTGTVHLPHKLAQWRFHGSQLSVQNDPQVALLWLKKLLERAAADLYRRHRQLLSRNDRAVLMLPSKRYLALSQEAIKSCEREMFWRTVWMIIERPASTIRAIRNTGFRAVELRQSLIPMFMQRLKLVPEKLLDWGANMTSPESNQFSSAIDRPSGPDRSGYSQ